MRKLRALWVRLGGLFTGSRHSSEFQAELESHLQMHTEENLRLGMSPLDARRNALLKLGGIEPTRESQHDRSTIPLLENLVRDVQFALRQMAKAPGFAVMAVLTLALGIGANTAIFSVVHAVLQNPAGVDHPERIGVLKVRYRQFNLDMANVSVPDYAEAASLVDHVEAAAIQHATSFNIEHDGLIEHVSAARVSWKWFQVFGARPILGRTFAPQEDQPDAGQVVVLSYGIWQSAFGGRRDVIGQTMLLDRKPYRIAGVMRSDFAWPRAFQMWIPIALPAAAAEPKEVFNENYEVVLRLRPAVKIQQFSAELSTKMWTVLRHSAAAAYVSSSGWSVYVAPLTEFAAGTLGTPLRVLFVVVGLVLLIAAANVAGLVLARASARSKEFAIRQALGASAGRLMQQVVVETMLLSGIAAAVGIAAGPALGRVILLMVPHNLSEGFTVQMNLPVMLFTAATALLAALIAGLGPTLKMLGQRTSPQLHTNARGNTVSVEKQRLRSSFVIGEVALAYLLLAGTGLFLASLAKLERVDPGFEPRGLLTAKVEYSGEKLKQNQARQAVFVRGVVDHLAALPGVRAAAAVAPLPFDDSIESSSFDIEGRRRTPNDPGPHSHLSYATPAYLKVMEIPLLEGRWFTDSDQKNTARVVVIDERLAQTYWPGQHAIGQHLDSGPGNSWATVVGVVRNIRYDSLEEDTTDGMRYYPYAQTDNYRANFVVRTDDDVAQLAAGLKQSVRAIDPAQAVSSVTSMAALVSDSLAGRKLIVWMLSAFAGLALLLAVIGIYGLISYVTAQRTSEIGIRMALGARWQGVVRLVLLSAMSWVGIGLSIGAVLSLIASALLNHVFAALGEGMIPSLAAAASILLAAGALAGFVPAQRAASIDPIRALRAE